MKYLIQLYLRFPFPRQTRFIGDICPVPLFSRDVPVLYPKYKAQNKESWKNGGTGQNKEVVPYPCFSVFPCPVPLICLFSLWVRRHPEKSREMSCTLHYLYFLVLYPWFEWIWILQELSCHTAQMEKRVLYPRLNLKRGTGQFYKRIDKRRLQDKELQENWGTGQRRAEFL